MVGKYGSDFSAFQELPPALRETKAEKKVNKASNTMEFTKRKHAQAMQRDIAFNPNDKGQVYSVEEGLKYLLSQKSECWRATKRRVDILRNFYYNQRRRMQTKCHVRRRGLPQHLVCRKTCMERKC